MFVWWVRLIGWAIAMGILAIIYNAATSNADEYGAVVVILLMIVLTGRVLGGVLLELAVSLMWVLSRGDSQMKSDGS